jgi:catechol 2,3-dioxygenase-like lactoylglutathione lyase family enzyme
MTTSVVSIVYVNDAPAAARFYGDLLGMSPSFETPGYITFDLGPGADLALCGLASSRICRRTSRVPVRFAWPSTADDPTSSTRSSSSGSPRASRSCTSLMMRGSG